VVLCDVFGTIVDWRGSLIRQLEKLSDRRGWEIDHSVAASHEEIDTMVGFWHCLDAWPDAPTGIRRLKRRFIVGTMSNGNVALLVDLAKYADLEWDVVLSAEFARRYKKDLDCYRFNVGLLDRPLSSVLMVAAHPGELAAVSTLSMKTAFVHRPGEFGDHGQTLPPDQLVDFACNGIDELATALGV
jgi:2-haloacid dehalogenase